jgi:pimeloyl-ACP methyl ester carboxylesterase
MIQEKEIVINNQRISYKIKSINIEDPIMFFLHGWGSNKESFNYFFSKYNNCIAFDFPSCGKSGNLKSVYTLENYVNLINAFYEKVIKRHEKCIIVTHSFGGRVLLKWISKFKIKFASLVFIGVPFFRKLSFLQKLQIKITTILNISTFSFFKHIFKGVYSNLFKNNDYNNLKSEIEKNTFKNIIHTNIAIFLPLLKNKKITFIWGEKDDQAPLYNLLEAKKILPSAKIYIIKNAKHFPWIDKEENFPIIN